MHIVIIIDFSISYRLIHIQGALPHHHAQKVSPGGSMIQFSQSVMINILNFVMLWVSILVSLKLEKVKRAERIQCLVLVHIKDNNCVKYFCILLCYKDK